MASRWVDDVTAIRVIHLDSAAAARQVRSRHHRILQMRIVKLAFDLAGLKDAHKILLLHCNLKDRMFEGIRKKQLLESYSAING